MLDAIEGDAAKDLQYIDDDAISAASGLEYLMEFLRKRYDERPLLRKAAVLGAWEKTHRMQGETMRKYINRWLRLEQTSRRSAWTSRPCTTGMPGA